MTFMNPEPDGAREANRMMMGDAASALGVDTAPGSMRALKTTAERKSGSSLFIVGFRRWAER
jgi:hypothetical protein